MPIELWYLLIYTKSKSSEYEESMKSVFAVYGACTVKVSGSLKNIGRVEES